MTSLEGYENVSLLYTTTERVGEASCEFFISQPTTIFVIFVFTVAQQKHILLQQHTRDRHTVADSSRSHLF